MTGPIPEGLRILFIEDQPDDVELERRQLERDGLVFEWRAVSSDIAMRREIDEFRPHVVLCDYSIPGFSGRQALGIAHEIAPSIPFIFVSGTIGEETAVACLRDGATDYVLKDNPQRLGAAVRRALSEVEERKAYEARIQYLANYDALTDLPNRTLIADRVGQALIHARRTGRHLALLTVNIDHFRLVNEGFGHAAGDAVLKEMAARVHASVREGDTVARTGVDEFTALVSDLERPEDVHPFARKILDALKFPHTAGNQEIRITASAGAAVFPHDGEDAETLLRNASAAMHRAKALERGAFQFASQDTMREAVEQIMIETELSLALQHGELRLEYQLQYDLRDDRACGAEALMRWPRADGTSVPPATFIPVAEETGLIHAAGLWALEEACTTALPWVRANDKFVLSVNVSIIQLKDAGFVEAVARILEATQFPVKCLELEVTESALMSTAASGPEAIARLKALGLKIAMDDFGTGYSSLSYLSRLPIDRLKIDASFVSRITTDPRDAGIAQSIVSLGHGLGLKVIAEGVETREQLAALRQMGCDQAQGFLLARPVGPQRIPALLSAGRNPAGESKEKGP